MENIPMTFSPRKGKSNKNCCVPQCSSKACRDTAVRFHEFPKPGDVFCRRNDWGVMEKVDRRKLWIHRLKIGKKVTKNMLVCSLHFVKNDYILPDLPARHRFLKRGAVPSMNLPVSSVEKSRVVVHRRHGRREEPIKIQSGGLIKAVAEYDEADTHQLLASPIDEPTKDSSIETQEIAAAEALISLGDGECSRVT